MPEERRSARRARISGVSVTYESASGDVHQAEVANLSRDGIFIVSRQPLTVGKRLSLELLVAGEAGPWAALGRIIWIRTVGEGDERPAGMAVKIIDIEESVAVAIDRLIELRERTEPGLGAGGAAPPAREKLLREKTMMGIGLALPGGHAVARPEPTVPRPEPAVPGHEGAHAAPAPAPPPAAAPAPARVLSSREKTVLGVGLGAAAADPREPSAAIDLVVKKAEPTEPSLALDLVAKKPAASRPSPAEEPSPAIAKTRSASDLRASEEAADRRLREFERAAGPADEDPSSEAPVARRRSGFGWWVLLVILVACGVSAYLFRDRLLPLWQSVVTDVLKRAR